MKLETQVGLMSISILKDLEVENMKTYEKIPLNLLVRYSQLNMYLEQERSKK